MFWLIYYGGHGASIDNTNSMILNTREGAWTFPIEHRIRLLCHTPYNFVMAVMDCCRTQFPDDFEELKFASVPKEKDKNNINSAAGDNRAGNNQASAQKSYKNGILIFGCAPSFTVAAKSTVAVETFSEMQERGEEQSVVLPDDIVDWNPGNDGEILTLCTDKLRLKFKRTFIAEKGPVSVSHDVLELNIPITVLNVLDFLDWDSLN